MSSSDDLTWWYMPGDDTQSLGDVLDAMRRNDLQRQAAFVEWLAASLSEMDDVVARLRAQRDPTCPGCGRVRTGRVCVCGVARSHRA